MPDLPAALFLGQRPIDALGATNGPLARIVACEGGPEATLVAERLGCAVDSLEDRLGVRRLWTGATVADAAEALLAVGALPPGTEVLAYASSRRLRALLTGASVLARAADARLKDRLDDKLATRLALRRLGVPVPNWIATRVGDLAFDDHAARFGVPFVVQRPRGSAGIGTWIVDGLDDIAQIRIALGRAQQLMVSRHAGATVLNVHVVVCDATVCVSPVSVQATGIPELADGAARYCGNDFSAARTLDPTLLMAIDGHARTVGAWLASQGYIGVLGMDFATDGVGVRALEINPRMQGSTWLLAELERAAGRQPIAELHRAAWDPNRLGAVASHYTSAPLDGSLLVLHRCPALEPSDISELHSGIHDINHGGALVWRRDGCSPGDCRDAEFVVGGLVGAGVEIAPDGVLARLSTRGSLTTSDGHALSDYGGRVLAAVRRVPRGVPSWSS